MLCQVHNKSTAAATVTVAFDDHKDSKEILEEQVIQPGASFHFQSKELNMGTWTVCHILIGWIAVAFIPSVALYVTL